MTSVILAVEGINRLITALNLGVEAGIPPVSASSRIDTRNCRPAA